MPLHFKYCRCRGTATFTFGFKQLVILNKALSLTENARNTWRGQEWSREIGAPDLCAGGRCDGSGNFSVVSNAVALTRGVGQLLENPVSTAPVDTPFYQVLRPSSVG